MSSEEKYAMSVSWRNRKQKLMLVSLAAAITAGTMCGGVASADTPADAPATIDSGSPASYSWSVSNYTDQTLTAGEFYKQQDGRTSRVVFGDATGRPALAPGQLEAGQQPYKYWTFSPTYTWGRVCYNHQWWNLPRDGKKRFEWDDVYLFAFDDGHGGKKLVANPTGAGKDIPMIATDAC